MPFRVMDMMRVLAIDPGYGRCGIAVLERLPAVPAHAGQAGSDKTDTLLFSACIETSGDLEFTERLRIIITEIERVLRAHKPRMLAIEKLFFKANRMTAMRVSEVRGAILSSAAAAGLEIHEYGPAEVKLALTGDGRADKAQVTRMINMLVKIPQSVPASAGRRLDDEYDAIAVGLTHLARARAYSPALREKI